jgi:hypothetical protein
MKYCSNVNLINECDFWRESFLRHKLWNHKLPLVFYLACSCTGVAFVWLMSHIITHPNG